MHKFLFKGFAIVVLAASLGLGWFLVDYWDFLNSPLELSAGEETFEVAPGTSMRGIAGQLHARGVIRSPRYFEWHARLRGVAGSLHAGEYRLLPELTPAQLIENMSQGKVMLHAVTIVEGWTFRQMLEILHANEHLQHTLRGLEPEEIMARLGYPDEHPEGQFFPDTYRFPSGTSDLAVLARAYQATQEHLAREWQTRDPDVPLDSPYEALILASIVEKETGVPSERGQIAGVFARRLQKGMRLQTDPTVIYGLGTGFDGNLRRRHLREDGPYNTYRRGGLPPTPIALPGLASIQAALHPEPGDTLYFVSRGDGSHVFSATLQEHNEAVIRYQLKGRKQPFSSYGAAQ